MIMYRADVRSVHRYDAKNQSQTIGLQCRTSRLGGGLIEMRFLVTANTR
jgi:hypothetical protein